MTNGFPPSLRSAENYVKKRTETLYTNRFKEQDKFMVTRGYLGHKDEKGRMIEE